MPAVAVGIKRRTEPVTKAKTKSLAKAATRPSTADTPDDNPETRRRAALRASVRHILPRKPVAPPLPEPEGDEFTYMLARTLAMVTHAPRRCREPICRRMKVCAGATMRCRLTERPLRPLTPEQDAAARAAVLRAVQRRL